MKLSIVFLAVVSAMASISAEMRWPDPLADWLANPGQRDPSLHLAFVQVAAVSDQRYSFTNTPRSGSVSDDGGKTWYSSRKVRSGIATLKVIESVDGKLPSTLRVYFERSRYVPTRETPWVDAAVRPGSRFLGFFIQGPPDEWRLLNSWLMSPVDYFIDPSFGDRLQATFKSRLADPKDILQKRREMALLESGWSTVLVRVLDETSGSPVIGARIEQAYRGCVLYEGECAYTDANGAAPVLIHESWVALNVAQTGFQDLSINSRDTNAVAAFRATPVLNLQRRSE